MRSSKSTAKSSTQVPTQLRILGAMTGTSCDGMDVACVEFDPRGWSPLWTASTPYPATLRRQVLAAQKADGARQTLHYWMELDRDLGDWYGATLHRLIQKNRSEAPELIANHGQTLAHFPTPRANAGPAKTGMTLQLGDPTRIAYATGLSVIAKFRNGDMAAGGQGAPLVPRYHQLIASLLGSTEKGIAFHNLGGISNLTYLGPGNEVIAFDTGPANLWIDAAVELATRGKQKFDRGGKIGATGAVDQAAVRKILRHPFFKQTMTGAVDQAAVRKILRHPFFKQTIPKSTGRDDFPFSLLRKQTHAQGADLVATATTISVESIALAYERFILGTKRPLSCIVLCGGGAKNPNFKRSLALRLPNVRFRELSEVGLDEQYVEAQAFAYLGLLSLSGIPLGGSWTGVHEFAPPGMIVPGKNWSSVAQKLRKFV